MTDQKDMMIKTVRKTLRSVSADIENFTAKPPPAKKNHVLVQDTCIESGVKHCKETQTSIDNAVTKNDLTSTEHKSEKYWEIIAEKRRVALADTLKENEKLSNKVKELNETIERYKVMLEEMNSFVEVVKEQLNAPDDTGIDVNDVSTADESTDEPNSREH